ncbi:MAG TPA: GNAT family N-acetyltransferase [Longimicrobiaceae bacterium]|nr:GNAT family N-acetyltransferase [Longimicrobiaceae bacterium]
MSAVAAPPSPLALLLPAALRDRRGEPFRVREMEPADREALARFYEEFEPKRTAQGLPPQGSYRIGRWLDSVLDGGTHLLVEADRAVVGHAFLVPTGKPGVGEYAIFLDQGIRGRGVGTRVNRLTAEVARALGMRRLWLTVEPHNRAAIRSYEKTGFRFRPETVYSPEAEMELEIPDAAAPPRL